MGKSSGVVFHPELEILPRAQLPQDVPDDPRHPSDQPLATVLRKDHAVILVGPLDLGLALLILQGGPGVPEGLSSGRTVSHPRPEQQNLEESHRRNRWIPFMNRHKMNDGHQYQHNIDDHRSMLVYT